MQVVVMTSTTLNLYLFLAYTLGIVTMVIIWLPLRSGASKRRKPLR